LQWITNLIHRKTETILGVDIGGGGERKAVEDEAKIEVGSKKNTEFGRDY